jgi:diguanylate cyclase (GGDEF)-like protein
LGTKGKDAQLSKVLVVDDDPQFRSLVRSLLARRGHQIVEAATGAAGTECITRDPPDLIIIDGVLPDMDGMAWIQAARAAGIQTPVVFASAFWRDKRTFKKLTRELSVPLVVLKPIVPQIFADQVDRILRPTQVTRVADVDELALPRETYARELKDRVGELAAAIERLQKKLPDAPREVELLSHRLRGTAGSFGFHAVGLAAGQIEDLVSEPTRALGKGEWATINAAVISLMAAAALASSHIGSEQDEMAHPDRILVVDDDASFLSYVGELARRYAMDVLPALDAEAAEQLVRRQKPGAAILDVVLGQQETSFKLARDLRMIPGCESLPIAFISAYDDQQTRIAAAHAGGSFFLSKPLDGATFADAAQELLSQRPTRPRVLIVDDDAEFRKSTATVLAGNDMQVEGIPGTDDILAHLERFRPDILLIDSLLKEASGFDICRMIRTTPSWRDLPVVFLTSQVGEQTRIAAFQAGGDDYLPKPVLPAELLARLQVRLDRAKLMRERSDIDALTGICLRRSFLSRFASLLSTADRKEGSVSLCLIDIDEFKSINDTHGHLSGDRVLASFGRLLATRFRTTDLRARWGGEEFMLAFPGESNETTAGIAERLLEEVRGMTLESDMAERFRITFSAGVASYPVDGATVHDLVRTVDRRLYIAKRGGRNRVESKG